MAWRTDTAAAIDLTGKIKSRFDNDDRDVPDLPSPYGSAGWTADDDSVVVYDKFDLWAVQPATGQSATSRGAGAASSSCSCASCRSIPRTPTRNPCPRMH